MFREFKVGELLDCSTTKAYNPNKGDLPNGNTSYVTRSAFNNGISGFFDDESGVFMNSGNCITIGAEGGIAFYQPDDFIAGIKVYTLRHERMNCEIGMYLCSALNVHSHIYSYTNARVLDKIKAESIQLPVKPGTDEVNYTEDDIDWAFMESYIHELEESYIHELDAYLKETGLDDYELTDAEQELLEREPTFKEFAVGELFETYTISKKLTKAAFSLDGFIPVYSSDTRNNGVLGYTEQEPTFIVDKSKPTYLIFGDHTRTLNIVHESFCVMDNVKVLSPKFALSDESLLYIKTVWLKGIPVLGYARHWSVAKDVALSLPVKPGTDEVNYTDADIDWAYMDAYVRVTEKQVIADVVDYKNEVIATTKELVHTS